MRDIYRIQNLPQLIDLCVRTNRLVAAQNQKLIDLLDEIID